MEELYICACSSYIYVQQIMRMITRQHRKKKVKSEVEKRPSGSQ